MTLTKEQANSVLFLQEKVIDWLRQEGSARSTLAGAVVVIDTLRAKGQFELNDVFTNGGQLVSGRGTGLKNALSRYGEIRIFLADGVTTRSTMKFERLASMLEWGRPLSGWDERVREEAAKIIVQPVLNEINTFFERQAIKIKPNRVDSPAAWIEQVLEQAKNRSQGRVEQHLVGAKLERRLPDKNITDHAAFAADVQTDRKGDFVIGKIVFHVTAAPAAPVIEKCRENIRQGLHPILVSPRSVIKDAMGFAKLLETGLDRRISFVALEDFIATNIIELASDEDGSLYDVFSSIISIYNERIEASETDQSLRVDLE